MNERFLRYYHQELQSFTQQSKVFALNYPQVAKRLGLSAPEIEDPHVERLIEAVSFLTARVNLKIDAEYPEFVQHLLKVICPIFTYPTPTIGLIHIHSTYNNTFTLTKLSSVSTKLKKQGKSICDFSTCHDVNLYPFDISNIKYNNIYSNHLTTNKYIQSVFSFELSIPYQFNFEKNPVDELQFLVHANNFKASSELLYFLAEKVVFIELEIESIQFKSAIPLKIKLDGFDLFYSVYDERRLNYFQHLLEYAIFPEKYLFFSLLNLNEIFTKSSLFSMFKNNMKEDSDSYKFKLNFYFSEYSDYLQNFLGEECLSINNVLIVNAFKKETRINVNMEHNEHHVIVDPLRTQDFEILKVDIIQGFSLANHHVKTFEPLYHLDNDTLHFDNDSYGFFSEIYKPSMMQQKAHSYTGSECYIQLTNQIQHIKEDELHQLSIKTWCSNRGLASQISWSLDQDLQLGHDIMKQAKISRRSSFTTPLSIPLEESSLWRMMNVISGNFLPLLIDHERDLTHEIKNNLFLFFEISKSVPFKQQINAIQHIFFKKMSKVIRLKNQLVSISGLQFIITLDEMLMSHVHPYLWSKILMEYLKSFVPINHYIELQVKNQNHQIMMVLSTH